MMSLDLSSPALLSLLALYLRPLPALKTTEHSHLSFNMSAESAYAQEPGFNAAAQDNQTKEDTIGQREHSVAYSYLNTRTEAGVC